MPTEGTGETGPILSTYIFPKELKSLLLTGVKSSVGSLGDYQLVYHNHRPTHDVRWPTFTVRIYLPLTKLALPFVAARLAILF